MMGVVVACFALATDRVQELFIHLVTQQKYAPLLLTPCSFAISAWLILRYFPAAAGSGVPQAIAAQGLEGKEDQQYLLGLKVIAGKIMLVLLVLAGGASVGREGPSVQIVGAGLMLFFATVARLQDRRTFIMAGGAAGVAAAFNTPIAGIAFLIEEMARGMQYTNRLTLLAIIVLSGIAAMMITGNYDYFGYIKSDISLGLHWVPILVIGIVCGFAGSIFNILILDGRRYLYGIGNGFGTRNPVYFAAICGLGVATLGNVRYGITGNCCLFCRGYPVTCYRRRDCAGNHWQGKHHDAPSCRIPDRRCGQQDIISFFHLSRDGTSYYGRQE